MFILELNYCEKNHGVCKNGAKCISLTKEDGNYRCLCREGTYGRNCEDSDIFTVKPVTPNSTITVTSTLKPIYINISSSNNEEKPISSANVTKLEPVTENET